MTTSRAARFMPLIGLGLAAVGLTQCDRPEPPTPAPEAPPPALAPAPVSTLGRAEMIAALSEAASAYAVGQPVAASIVGRTFEMRLPFGCTGPSATPAGLAGWRWSADRQRLELTLTPADWTRSPLVLPTGAAADAQPDQHPDWERVEGLWIARPWIAEAVCPHPAASAPQPEAQAEPTGDEAKTPTTDMSAAPGPTVAPEMSAGLAVIETAETSRLGRRRGEAWRHVVRGANEQPAAAPSDGYRLVLGGRVGRFPDGQAIRCSSDNPDQRPVCIAAVELDLIAFEDAAGVRLSEWRLGG